MEIFLQIAVGLLGTAIAGLFTWGMLKLRQLVSAKVSNEILKGILTRLNDAVETAVKSVAQAYVDPMKKSNDFGPEAQTVAKAKAIEAVKSYMGQKGLNELTKVMGWNAVDENLDAKVEAKVADLKV